MSVVKKKKKKKTPKRLTREFRLICFKLLIGVWWSACFLLRSGLATSLPVIQSPSKNAYFHISDLTANVEITIIGARKCLLFNCLFRMFSCVGLAFACTSEKKLFSDSFYNIPLVIFFFQKSFRKSQLSFEWTSFFEAFSKQHIEF